MKQLLGAPFHTFTVLLLPANLLEIFKSYWSFLIGKAHDDVLILFMWIWKSFSHPVKIFMPRMR